MSLSYILFELIDAKHCSPISHKIIKMPKVNYLDLELAIDPSPPWGIVHTMIS